jgi:hypothetical protein
MNRNDFDLNLIVGLLSLATGVLGILLTLLIVAFGPLAALIVVAFIAGSVITGTVMWRFQRRAPP